MGTRLHNICTQFLQSGWRSTINVYYYKEQLSHPTTVTTRQYMLHQKSLLSCNGSCLSSRWYNNQHGGQGTVTCSWGAWWGVPLGGKRRGWSYGNSALELLELNDWFGVWFLAVATGWLFQDSTNDCTTALIHGAKTQLVQAKQANFNKAVQLIFRLKPQVFHPFIVCGTRSYKSWDTWMLFYHVAPNVNIFVS